MKKRLSLLMAVLMIVSLLPMSAFAAAKPVTIVQNVDTETKSKVVEVAFEIDETSVITKMAAGLVEFRLTNGAKFADWDVDGDSTVTEGENNVKLEAKYNDGTSNGANNGKSVKPVADVAFIDLVAEPTITKKLVLKFKFAVDFRGSEPGDVKLDITDNSKLGSDENSIGSQAVTIAVVKAADTSELAVEVKDAEKTVSFDGGAISQFTIKNFSKIKEANQGDFIELELDEDFAWDIDTSDKTNSPTKVFVDGKNITDTVNTAAGSNILRLRKVDVENAKSIIVMPAIKAMGRSAAEGRVDLVVRRIDSATKKTFASTKTVIGKVVDYNVTITVVEKNKKEIPSLWGGEESTVTVTLKGPKGSILNRNVEFTVDGAKVFHDGFANPKKTALPKADKKDGDFAKNGEFIAMPEKDIVEMKFDMKIKTDGDKDGIATITAAQRGWETKADLAKIAPKFKLTAEVMPVKKGEARMTGNVVVTEAKAGLLEKGQYLLIAVPTRGKYTQFSTKDVKVEATNGLKLGEAKFVDLDFGTATDPDPQSKFATLQFEIKKSSHGEPSVITISNMGISIDGSATDDVIKVQGRVSEKDDKAGDKVSVADYVKVVKEYALESITTVFTIGQTQYTKNGQAMTAASAPYIKNGKTMLPIRAVAEALGLAVQWNGATKTATFSDATKVAAVTIGAEKMFVNGTPVPLAAKAELVNGTTFVELRSLSTAFGVQIDWDAAAKTATVSK